jgi:hypothetical protein
MPLESLRKDVVSAIESMAGELPALSRAIHAEPELALHEFKAAARLTAALERHGLLVVHEAYGLATAYAAVIDGAKALALTALDLMADEDLRARVRADFAATAKASVLAVAEVSHRHSDFP